MTNKNNIKKSKITDKYKGKECSYIGVYCTETDLNDPTVLRLAVSIQAITQEQYEAINAGGEIGLEAKSSILEALFGFCKGNYEQELVEGYQKTRFGRVVENEYRYTGIERIDKEWVESSMCSDEVKQLFKFGEVL